MKISKEEKKEEKIVSISMGISILMVVPFAILTAIKFNIDKNMLKIYVGFCTLFTFIVIQFFIRRIFNK